MNILSIEGERPLFSVKGGFVFFAAMLVAMGTCVAIPRLLTFLPALVATSALIIIYLKSKKLPAFDLQLAGFFAAFLALTALSIFWAIDPAFAMERTAKATPLFIAGIISLAMATLPPFVPARQNRIAIVAVIFCSIGGLIICSEYNTQFALTKFLMNVRPDDYVNSIQSGFVLNRSLVYLVLFSLPVFLALKLSTLKHVKKLILGMTLAVCLCLALLHTHSQTAQIAAIIIVFMAAYPAHKKKARITMMAGLIAGMLSMPFMMKAAHDAFLAEKVEYAADSFINKASIPHRLEVWDFISDKIVERPLLGYGTEAARFLKSDKIMPNMGVDHVLHPHNFVLQIWLEFGLVGVLLACAFTVFIIRRLDRFSPLLQRYYSALFVTIFCVMCIGYGLWQAWQIGMIFALTSLSIMVVHAYGADAHNRVKS